jgi:hypothetical protein
MSNGREQFFEGMRSAPFAAHQFVQAIHHRYDPRNDVEVHYAEVTDLRLKVVWENSKGKHDHQNFARFIWQKRNKVFYCETYVPHDELAELGFDDAKEHIHGPLLSQVRVGSDCWEEGERRAAFFRTLDLACVRMTQAR